MVSCSEKERERRDEHCPCLCKFTILFFPQKAPAKGETVTYAVSHVTGWAVSIIDVRHFDEE